MLHAVMEFPKGHLCEAGKEFWRVKVTTNAFWKEMMKVTADAFWKEAMKVTADDFWREAMIVTAFDESDSECFLEGGDESDSECFLEGDEVKARKPPLHLLTVSHCVSLDKKAHLWHMR